MSRVLVKDGDVSPADLEVQAEDLAGSQHFQYGVDFSERRGTIPGTIANTCNTIVGAGVLGLPYAISQIGYVAGVLLFILGAGLTQYGLHLLFSVMTKLGGDQLSFGRVAESINPYVSFTASFLVWLICFTISVLYLNITASFLIPAAQYFAPDADQDSVIFKRTFWLTLAFLLLGMPLSIPRKMTILQYTSALAMLFILYTAIVIVVYAFKPVEELCSRFLDSHGGNECFGEFCCVSSAANATCCIGPTMAFTSDFASFAKSFPVIITAFCCSPQVFAFYNDLKNPTMRRLNTSTITALSLTSLLYLMVSIGGYSTFGSMVSDDLLGSYPLTLEITLARLGVAFLTAVSYPLLLQPARDSFLHLVSYPAMYFVGKDISSPTYKYYRVAFYTSLVVMLVSTYCLGLAGLSIGFLLNLGGSLSVANLSFTLPGIFFLHYFKDSSSTCAKASGWFMVVFGLFIMIANIILWIL